MQKSKNKIMTTKFNFSDFCEAYNYDFSDEIKMFQVQNKIKEIKENDLEVRVFDSGEDVVVSVHYFAGVNKIKSYVQPDGWAEVIETAMLDTENETHVREIIANEI